MRDWSRRHFPLLTWEVRLRFLRIIFILAAAAILGRLFIIQVLRYDFYRALALGQREIYRQLLPERGEIFVLDRAGKHSALATNDEQTLAALDLRKIKNPTTTARLLSEQLGLDELELKALLARADDPYEPLVHRLPDAVREVLTKLELPGLLLLPEMIRVYPEPDLGGHLLGFLGASSSGELGGRYGLEGHYDKELRGQQGFLAGERDPAGRLIPLGSSELKNAEDGLDLILNIDRSVQFFACERLKQAVARHGAAGGGVVILSPKTGAVLALCAVPDFDPNVYNKVADINVFNNPVIFNDYEPGSVIKPITLSAALEAGKITPETTYQDSGGVMIGSHLVRNSDGQAHGQVNMTRVLEESLNTGAIFAMRQIGGEVLRDYFERFGFGRPTGIDLDTEATGNINSLRERSEIYSATASFGQGITVTTLQLASAFAALANEGRRMKPRVVKTLITSQGQEIPILPEPLGQVVSSRTARLMGAMLVSVVEQGHGRRAGVPGYYIAGKTGTAQVPKKDGLGYEKDLTIGTFAGYGPIEEPIFAMVTRIDHPRDVQFAESSAAPLLAK